MFAFLEAFFVEYGYAAVFFVLVICGFGVPIPEDLTLVTGGVISGMGYTNPHIGRGRHHVRRRTNLGAENPKVQTYCAYHDAETL